MFPKGFKVLGIHSGVYRDKKKKDLAVFYSDLPGKAAAVYTVSKLKSSSIKFNLRNVDMNSVQAVFVNSGCANTCTGQKGIEDIKMIAKETARGLNISCKNVLTASTGVIGTFLPVKKMLSGIKKVTKDIYFHNRSFPLSGAEAIMTTDTQRKVSSKSFKISGRKVNIWGCAKGSGMIHPDMATMLCFIFTDIMMPASLLNKILKSAVEKSFNMITVDGETSPNDSVFLFANKASNVSLRNEDRQGCGIFQKHLDEVCSELARKIVEDAEGARKLFFINVYKARNFSTAKELAGLISTSPLVKTAFAGGDANWGRIMAVIGRSGLRIDPDKVDIYFNNIQVAKSGVGIPSSMKKAGNSLGGRINNIEVVLNQGDAQAVYKTCDLTEMYVRINANLLT